VVPRLRGLGLFGLVQKTAGHEAGVRGESGSEGKRARTGHVAFALQV
jgi:hypothetical protein